MAKGAWRGEAIRLIRKAIGNYVRVVDHRELLRLVMIDACETFVRAVDGAYRDRCPTGVRLALAERVSDLIRHGAVSHECPPIDDIAWRFLTDTYEAHRNEIVHEGKVPDEEMTRSFVRTLLFVLREEGVSLSRDVWCPSDLLPEMEEIESPRGLEVGVQNTKVRTQLKATMVGRAGTVVWYDTTWGRKESEDGCAWDGKTGLSAKLSVLERSDDSRASDRFDSDLRDLMNQSLVRVRKESDGSEDEAMRLVKRSRWGTGVARGESVRGLYWRWTRKRGAETEVGRTEAAMWKVLLGQKRAYLYLVGGPLEELRIHRRLLMRISESLSPGEPVKAAWIAMP